MPMYETEPQYNVVCDGDDCFEESAQEPTERGAEKSAREGGYEQVDGKWYCPSCLTKAKRKAKKARSK
jgi:hypothetical protein